MSNNKKKQHIVPKVYLKRFCVAPDKVNVYDKLKNETRINQNIEDVASENCFYDIDFAELGKTRLEPDGPTAEELYPEIAKLDPKLIENMFNKIEADYNKIIGPIIDRIPIKSDEELKNHCAITKEERAFIAVWLAHQSMRSKASRGDLCHLLDALAAMQTEIYNKKHPFDPDIYFAANTDKKALKALHGFMLLHPENIAERASVFAAHTWRFMINRSSIHFVTSDNPIVTIPHGYDIFGYPGTGIANDKVEVYFPLSPNFGLMMYEKSLELQGEDRYCIICNDENVIIGYNIAILERANRFIISDTADFNLFQRYMKERPSNEQNGLTMMFNGKDFHFN